MFFLFLWPWPWPTDLDIRTWPRYSDFWRSTSARKMKFLAQGFQRLEHEQNRQTDTRRQTWLNALPAVFAAESSCCDQLLNVAVHVLIPLEYVQSYVEVYDLQKDPFQLKNIRDSVDPNLMMELNKRLLQLSVCSGSSCHDPDSPRRRILHFDPRIFLDTC